MIADIAEASKGRPVKFAGVGLSAIYVRPEGSELQAAVTSRHRQSRGGTAGWSGALGLSGRTTVLIDSS